MHPRPDGRADRRHHHRQPGDKFEEVARLAVRLTLQSALEAEVTELFGRDRYARASGIVTVAYPHAEQR